VVELSDATIVGTPELSTRSSKPKYETATLCLQSSIAICHDGDDICSPNHDSKYPHDIPNRRINDISSSSIVRFIKCTTKGSV